ncbi:MAG: hypothetical protein WC879_12290 [Melioribacteraceae bacterium]
MKVQVINTDFLHDGTYYYQKSIIDVSPELLKKYPRNLLAVAETVDVPNEDQTIIVDNISSEMVQNNSNLSAVADANNMLAPSAGLAPSAEIVKSKVFKKNKRGRKC